MKLVTTNLSSEDISRSRKEIDLVYKIYREGAYFTKDDLEEAIKEANKRIQKTENTPKNSGN